MEDTPEGLVAIEELSAGDAVWTRHESQPEGAIGWGTVTQTFCDSAPAIVWLTFDTGSVVGTTPDHEVWTREAGWTTAGEVYVGDTFAGRGSNGITITAVELDPSPSPVFNLEVAGTYTYFVRGVWVHNRSCPRPLATNRRHGGLPHTGLIQERLEILRRNGAKDIRMNQALVSPTRGKLTDLRPDIQYRGADGKFYIEEIVDTNPPDWGRESEFMRLLGDEFGGFDLHFVE
jgi:hypothetical protein